MPRIVKRIIGFFAILVSLVLFAGIALLAVFAHGNSSPPALLYPFPEVDGVALERYVDASSAVVRFDVRRGESAQSVGNRLAAAGLIRNRDAWNLLGRFRDEHIKAGSYLIEFPSSKLAIRRLLEAGREILLRVTVPEGLTVRETALLMEEAGITTAGEFIAAASSREILDRFRIPNETMEGYLFPDTYFFPAGFPAERVVQTMADNFFARIAAIDRNMLAMSPEDLNRLVVLASIVEKEYRVPEEAAVMAGVFSNRLDIGMMLQSCATIVYILAEVLGEDHHETILHRRYGNRILYRHLEIRSPFNTYMLPGLPPSPIASPGVIALQAAFSPARTEYLFFRLRNEATGHHTFSRTMAEHIRAGELFVRGW
ncbi:MAG: endolytic transglycosylase MltG [Treponema sp.]|nr:endolytic transglycosylase MltG [Treponema sp.]